MTVSNTIERIYRNVRGGEEAVLWTCPKPHALFPKPYLSHMNMIAGVNLKSDSHWGTLLSPEDISLSLPLSLRSDGNGNPDVSEGDGFYMSRFGPPCSLFPHNKTGLELFYCPSPRAELLFQSSATDEPVFTNERPDANNLFTSRVPLEIKLTGNSERRSEETFPGLSWKCDVMNMQINGWGRSYGCPGPRYL